VLTSWQRRTRLPSNSRELSRLQRRIPKLPDYAVRKAVERAKMRDNPPCNDSAHQCGCTTVFRLVERLRTLRSNQAGIQTCNVGRTSNGPLDAFQVPGLGPQPCSLNPSCSLIAQPHSGGSSQFPRVIHLTSSWLSSVPRPPYGTWVMRRLEMNGPPRSIHRRPCAVR
jgi:hypothetical protein